VIYIGVPTEHIRVERLDLPAEMWSPLPRTPAKLAPAGGVAAALRSCNQKLCCASCVLVFTPSFRKAL